MFTKLLVCLVVHTDSFKYVFSNDFTVSSNINSHCTQVDTKSKRHGGELVGDILKSHGVEYIFTLCGGHISPILVASEKIGIRIVDVRHEATAVFAADAVARLSGRCVSFFVTFKRMKIA